MSSACCYPPRTTRQGLSTFCCCLSHLSVSLLGSRSVSYCHLIIIFLLRKCLMVPRNLGLYLQKMSPLPIMKPTKPMTRCISHDIQVGYAGQQTAPKSLRIKNLPFVGLLQSICCPFQDLGCWGLIISDIASVRDRTEWNKGDNTPHLLSQHVASIASTPVSLSRAGRQQQLSSSEERKASLCLWKTALPAATQCLPQVGTQSVYF